MAVTLMLAVLCGTSHTYHTHAHRAQEKRELSMPAQPATEPGTAGKCCCMEGFCTFRDSDPTFKAFFYEDRDKEKPHCCKVKDQCDEKVKRSVSLLEPATWFNVRRHKYTIPLEDLHASTSRDTSSCKPKEEEEEGGMVDVTSVFDYFDSKTAEAGGVYYHCCCQANEARKHVSCELVSDKAPRDHLPAMWYAPLSDCGMRHGPGWHSFKHFEKYKKSKYKGFENAGNCMVPKIQSPTKDPEWMMIVLMDRAEHNRL